MKIALVLALFCGSALAQDYGLDPKLPYKEIEVRADRTPTPFLTGYIPETQECHLLINTSTAKPTGIADLVGRAHEAGHCHALRRGKQSIGAATRYGEAYGDVFALAWISKHHPDQLKDAINFLMVARSPRAHQQRDPIYNTLLVIHRAMDNLPSDKDPVLFTEELLE